MLLDGLPIPLDKCEKVQSEGVNLNQMLAAKFQQTVRRHRETGSYHASWFLQEGDVLDFINEASAYKTRVIAKRPEHLRPLISQLAEQISFSSDTRQIRVIPAHVAEKLDGLAIAQIQDIGNQHACHTVIFLNGAREHVSEEAAQTVRAELQKYLVKRGLRVTVLLHLFTGKPTIGTVRGVITDAAILAALHRNLDDPIIISNDVDQIKCSPYYNDIIASQFERHTLDVLTGPIYYGYSPAGQEYSETGLRLCAPELLLGNRVFLGWNALLLNGFFGTGRLFTTEGPNSIFRASAICAAGGYDYSLSVGEDTAMGTAVFALRQSAQHAYVSPANAEYSYRSWLATNPRRSLKAIAADKCIRNSWEHVSFKEQGGYTLDLRSLSEVYKSQLNLLQMNDLDISCGSPVRGKFKERLKKIFLTSLQNTFLSEADLPLYASYFGIQVDGDLSKKDISGEIYVVPDLYFALQQL